MRAMRLAAHAKVNLTLDVVGRRPDGYHELRSVFARISLADEVRVSRAKTWHIAIRPPLDARPDLAERAAHELARRSGRGAGAAITIRKRIPLASGLGGGSSDAAHTLRALGTLWRVDDATIAAAAAAVGSDVPFFLDGAIAEVAGRGEIVRPLAGGPWWGVLVHVRGRVSTAEAFARLGPRVWRDGRRTSPLVAALRGGTLPAAALRRMCGNDLDEIASSLCPAIAAARAKLLPTPLFLSGSGPTLFAIADDRGDAIATRRRAASAGERARVVQIAIEPGSPSGPRSRARVSGSQADERFVSSRRQ